MNFIAITKMLTIFIITTVSNVGMEAFCRNIGNHRIPFLLPESQILRKTA
jgi:hypothetical protein